MSPQSQLRPYALTAVALLAAGWACPGLAQPSSPAQALLDDNFVINVGAFVFQTDTKAQLNGQSVSNPEVDFDKSFGKPKDANRVRADALWRITTTHHAPLMYFNYDKSRSSTLADPIRWGDYTFQAGANVRSDSKFSILELAYEYAFMRQPSYEVAATIGVHYTDISLRFSGAATIANSNGTINQVAFASREASAPAPLPVIGLRGGWAVAPNWYVDAQGQYFQAKVGEVDGSISDLRVGATWMFSRHLGLGLGYNRFFTKVDVAKESFNGRLKFGYSGLQAYLTGSF
jgi:hypothetical protein